MLLPGELPIAAPRIARVLTRSPSVALLSGPCISVAVMPSRGRQQLRASLDGVDVWRRQQAAAARRRRAERRRLAEKRKLEKKTMQFGYGLLNEIQVPGYKESLETSYQDQLIHRVIPMLQKHVSMYPR